MDGEMGIRPATAADWRVLASVLAHAFYDDPFMEFSLPDRASRLERAETMFFGQFEAYFAHVGEVSTTAELSGAAVWTGADDRAPDDAVVDVTTRMDSIFGNHGRVIGAALHEIERMRPAGRQVYVDFLGTDPRHQRHGVGTALLAHVAVGADADGAPMTLWTATEANVSFYRGRGFDVTAEVRPQSAPRVWWMKRETRPA